MYNRTYVGLLMYAPLWGVCAGATEKVDPLPPAPVAVYGGMSRKIFEGTGP